MKKSKLTLSPELQRQQYRPSYPIWTVLAFFATMAAGFVLAFLLFLRPTYSEGEKRTLATFPAFSMATLLDGSYFADVDLWFSDTFPLREEMVSANAHVQALYGIRSAAVYTDVSSTFDDDEIPEPPKTSSTTAGTTITTDGTTTTTETTTAPTDTTGTSDSTQKGTTTTEVTTTPTTGTTTQPTDNGGEAPLVQQLGSVLVVGNHAYEYYSFSQSAADRYIGTVSRAADRLAGKANVYDILVPLAIDIVLDDAVRAGVSSADQKKAMDYIYGSMSPAVKTVDAYSLLRQHRNEYLYFRTDHHWTATGAYYAYAALCEAKGIAAPALGDYETMNFGGYLGSLYSKVGKPAALGNTPDAVTAYLPPVETAMQYTDKNGGVRNWPVIQNVAGWNSASLYNTFIAGDNPFTVIQNKERTDGSSCVVIKESFGNAFVPFLVADYQTVYVIDYRYYNGELVDFVTQNGVQDVIFINNMSASRAGPLMEQLDKLVGQG